MGLHGQRQGFKSDFVEPVFIPSGPVSQAGQIERYILHGGGAHLPRLRLRLLFPLREAVAGKGALIPAIEGETGVAFLRRNVADQAEKIRGVIRGEKSLVQVNDRAGENEGLARSVPLAEDVEDRLRKTSRLSFVVRPDLAGGQTGRSNRLDVPKDCGNVPVQMDVREHGLPAPGGGQLGELVDEHLGELADCLVAHAGQVGRKRQVEDIPRDRPGEVRVQGGPEADHVGQQHLRVLGRLGDVEGVGEAKTEFLEILERLAAAVGAVNEAQPMQVDVARDMGRRDVGGKHLVESELPLDPVGQDQVRPFGPVGDVRVFLVLQGDELPDVVQGEAQAGMEAACLLEAALDELRVHQLADQRGRQEADAGGYDLALDVAADLLRRLEVDAGLAQERVDDPASVPAGDVLFGRPHEERQVGGLPVDHTFVAEAPSISSSALSAAALTGPSELWSRQKTRRWTTRAGMKR